MGVRPGETPACVLWKVLFQYEEKSFLVRPPAAPGDKNSWKELVQNNKKVKNNGKLIKK